MADTEQEFPEGFADVRRTSNANRNSGTSGDGLATPANYHDVGALRARLTVINAGYYTAARLNTMTKNDMVYAVRLNDDAAGVK